MRCGPVLGTFKHSQGDFNVRQPRLETPGSHLHRLLGQNIKGCVAYKQQKFVTALEAVESKLREPADSVPRQPFSVSSPVWSPGASLWGPCYKGTNPIHGGSTLRTYLPPKPSPPNVIIWGVRIEHPNLAGGGGEHKQSIATDKLVKMPLFQFKERAC